MSSIYWESPPVNSASKTIMLTEQHNTLSVWQCKVIVNGSGQVAGWGKEKVQSWSSDTAGVGIKEELQIVMKTLGNSGGGCKWIKSSRKAGSQCAIHIPRNRISVLFRAIGVSTSKTVESDCSEGQPWGPEGVEQLRATALRGSLGVRKGWSSWLLFKPFSSSNV